MKNKQQKELKVIVNGEPDLGIVPESLMDALVAAIIEESEKLNKENIWGGVADLCNTKNG